MLIKDALFSETVYPIPINTIEKICIDRGLDMFSTYYTGKNKEYDLCLADIYIWLYNAPNFSEQEITMTLTDKELFLKKANDIYKEYDEAVIGVKLGFIGDLYNG